MMRFAPFFIVAIIVIAMAGVIVSGQPDTQSKTEHTPLPAFSLPLLGQKTMLKNADLKGHYTLLNIFASWCITCRFEHDFLKDLAKEKRIPIIGVAWKDKTENTRAWLKNLGNPYDKVVSDFNGDLVVKLGVTGTPESFLVNPDGVIVYHRVGMLNMDAFEGHILPLLPKLQEKK